MSFGGFGLRKARAENWLDILSVNPQDFEGDGLRANAEPWIEIERQIPDDPELEPRAFLEELTCPLLAIWGADDIMVPVEKSQTVFKESLKKAGNQDVTFRVIAGAGHDLMVPKAKNAPTSIADVKLPDGVVDWLLERFEVSSGLTPRG